MKRLMIGIMMVVLVFSFIGGASALYSDSEFGASVSNAGSLEIKLEQDNLANVELWPGGPAQYMIEIKNLGTIPLEYEVYPSVEGALAGSVTVDEVPGGTIGKGGFKKVFVTFTLPDGIDSAYKGTTGELWISVEAEQTGAVVGFTDSALISVPLVVASPLPKVKIVSPEPGTVGGAVLIEAVVLENFTNHTVVCSLDNFSSELPMMPDLGGTYSYLLDTSGMTDGAYTLDVRVEDGIGQFGFASVEFTIENTP